MSFSRNEFDKPEVQMKLKCVVYDLMGLHPLNTKRITAPMERQFNKILNNYINELPLDDSWSEFLTKDFNSVMQSQLFNENFKPERMHVVDNVPIDFIE